MAHEFPIDKVREDFPILAQKVHGKPLVFLDSAASSQKPQVVIDAMSVCYQQYYANVHRGVYEFSARSSEAFERTRDMVQQHIHAKQREEIIFVKGTTEGINLVAQTFGRQQVHSGDEVLISTMEHHANIVPWQMLCEQVGATLRVIPITDCGEIELDVYRSLLTPRTKLVAITHVSNVLGTINPIQEMISQAHDLNIPVLVDGAQALPHLSIDVTQLDCDFYLASSHKAFGPNSVGFLYGKRALLEKMPPYQGGGDMIRSVTFEKTEYNELPYKFEAGTPAIAEVIAFGSALNYLTQLGFENIHRYEQQLRDYAIAQLSSVPEVKLMGKAKHRVPVIAFNLEGIHAHDVGTILDLEGIAVRSGHHCAMPLAQRYGVSSSVRASLAFYNTHAEIDSLVLGLQQVMKVFR